MGVLLSKADIGAPTMREHSKRVKRLIREYASRAYEAELSRALGALEQQFAAWRSGQICAGELSDRVYAFTRGPARELHQRYNTNLDAMQVAHAIVTGLLPRDTIPAELLEALQPIIAFYEHEQAEPEQDGA
jgi:hypothetical protein